MTSSARYAIYFAPSADDPLWAIGSEWLGRDAYTGEDIERPEIEGISSQDFERLTSGPAHYGFHATMKAPFSLHEDQTELSLLEHLFSFTALQPAFDADVEVGALGQFLALRLKTGQKDMRALHEASVTEFDHFRAPLSKEDIERRRRADLSPLQDERMLKWGYPYIFDDFRWHMTLTSRVLNETTRDKLRSILAASFKPVISNPIQINGMAVYRQVDRCAPFRIIERAPFTAERSETRNANVSAFNANQSL